MHLHNILLAVVLALGVAPTYAESRLESWKKELKLPDSANFDGIDKFYNVTLTCPEQAAKAVKNILDIFSSRFDKKRLFLITEELGTCGAGIFGNGVAALLTAYDNICDQIDLTTDNLINGVEGLRLLKEPNQKLCEQVLSDFPFTAKCETNELELILTAVQKAKTITATACKTLALGQQDESLLINPGVLDFFSKKTAKDVVNRYQKDYKNVKQGFELVLRLLLEVPKPLTPALPLGPLGPLVPDNLPCPTCWPNCCLGAPQDHPACSGCNGNPLNGQFLPDKVFVFPFVGRSVANGNL